MADRPKAKPSNQRQRNDSRPNGKAPKKHPKDPNRNKVDKSDPKYAEREAKRKTSYLARRQAIKDASDRNADQLAAEAAKRESDQRDRMNREKRQRKAAKRLQKSSEILAKVRSAK